MDPCGFKILLLVLRTRQSTRVFEEIGVCCLAAYLRRHGYEVRLMEEYEDSLDYDGIRAFAPDLIGMPVYANTEKAVGRACARLKEILPATLLCLGGYAPTSRGARLMEMYPEIDLVVRGEGELTLKELADRLSGGKSLEGLRGLSFRHDGAIRRNGDRPQIQDLGALPWPDRDFIRDRGYQLAMVATSRGCTRNCSFCSTKQIWKRWRSRDLRDAVDEIDYLVSQWGIRSFYFVDCSFEDPGPSNERLTRLTEEIIARGLAITYSAFFRPDFHKRAEAGLLELLRKSGLIGALIGIESAHQAGLDLYQKRTTPEDNDKTVELFRHHGMNVEIGFIMFNPYTTFEGLRQDIQFLEKYGFAYDLANLTNQYAMSMGCVLDRRIQSDGLVTDEDDPYGYRFVDERIGRLAGHIRMFADRLPPETNSALLRVQRNIVNLAYWKRMFDADEILRGPIEETEYHFNGIRDKLNRHVSNWFRRLLDVAEAGWDEREAGAALAEMLSDRFILEAFQEMERRKDSLRAFLQASGYDIQRLGSSSRRVESP